MADVMRRLNVLENAQRRTVESSLEQLQEYIRAPSFSEERALDQLVSLRTLAKESNHPKSTFYNAVLLAMQEKTRVSDYQYKQYLRSLLRDKEDEKVLDAMTKVEKALRVVESGPSQGRSRGRDRGGVKCFSFGRVGAFPEILPLQTLKPGEKAKN